MHSPRALAAALALATMAGAQDDPRPRIGLVLSGGGARGAAHIGVIQVLEELHVPVDYVVGTSMGSIVGGLYAAGYSPDEMVETIKAADWATILSDAPPREDLWFRRREDNRRFRIDLEVGWRDGGPALPPGLILGRNVEVFLERLLLPVATTNDFDQLRLPFRCVATDIADGSAVVFNHGSVAKAIRASMSLPGIFAPVVFEGRVLVDGGIVDNVPVGVARRLGADIVIAVDISTPLADKDTIHSLLAVSDQVVGILMQANRRRSMGSLTKDDIGIVPDLGDLSVMQFDRSLEAIEIGHDAALAMRDRLAALAVDDATWAAWVARQRKPAVSPLTVRHLTIENHTGYSDSVIRELSALREGGPLDGNTLAATRQKIGGLGVTERIEIDVEPVPDSPGETDVGLRPIEKSWGRRTGERWTNRRADGDSCRR